MKKDFENKEESVDNLTKEKTVGRSVKEKPNSVKDKLVGKKAEKKSDDKTKKEDSVEKNLEENPAEEKIKESVDKVTKEKTLDRSVKEKPNNVKDKLVGKKAEKKSDDKTEKENQVDKKLEEKPAEEKIKESVDKVTKEKTVGKSVKEKPNNLKDKFVGKKAEKKSRDKTEKEDSVDKKLEEKSTNSEKKEGFADKSQLDLIVPGILISTILVVIELFFGVLLLRSRFLPVKYMLLVGGLLLIFTVLVAFLTSRSSKKLRFISGAILAAILSALLIYGSVGLSRVTSTLNTITQPNVQVTNVGLYVLKEDSARNLKDLDGEFLGILSNMERESTEGALEQIKGRGVETTSLEYDGLIDLLEGLYNQEARGILLSTAYLDVIEDIPGYKDIREKIREIEVFQVEGIANDETSNAADDGIFTVYISGIDSRDGLTAKGRSDVNILATVNIETHQVLLVTTPRDYYVELPISNGARDKLTHAGIYGVETSMETLSMLYNVDVDYYFRICFEGAEDMVDAVGGVSVYSDYEFTTKNGAYTFQEGYNDMNGKEALAFSRERYAFISGDRQRGKNQTALIKAIIDKAMSPDILMNYSSILKAVEGNFATSMSYDTIADLASGQLEKGGKWEVISYSVDGTSETDIPYSMSMPAYVMVPDETTVLTAQELIQSVLNGERISEVPKTSDEESLDY